MMRPEVAKCRVDCFAVGMIVDGGGEVGKSFGPGRDRNVEKPAQEAVDAGRALSGGKQLEP